MIYGNTVGGSGGGGGFGRTFIIEDADGNQLVGVVTDKRVVFDATPNDIRKGKVAATMEGVTTGEKVIPSYNTAEGYKVIAAGKPIKITNLEHSDYTKLQAMICAYNSSIAKSVATEKVCINNSVYAVSATEVIATVTVDAENKVIDLGIVNDSEKPVIVRYFTYKEIY